MVNSSKFFEKKKGWSLLKDQIVNCYLKPYIAKILATQKPLIIVDCFAGKGRFDDGNPGSPIMIANHIKDSLKSNRNKQISGIFIEKVYADDLKINIAEYSNCKVWAGTFEDNSRNILGLNKNSNVFLYVDPCGIKVLDFNIFKSIKNASFYSIELLMNFNSFGFLREGCRLLGDTLSGEEDVGYDDEADDTNSIENMNSIANGDYWQRIVRDKIENKLTMEDAEEKFISEYTKQLNTLFHFVVDIPVKVKAKNIPKYRLIFGTNHKDGLILMADEMNKAWNMILQQERKGQLVIMEYEFPKVSLPLGFNLEDGILDTIKQYDKPILLEDFIVVLIIEKYGISFSVKEYKNILRRLEGDKIDIIREPSLTPTGKKAISMEYKDYRITIKLK